MATDEKNGKSQKNNSERWVEISNFRNVGIGKPVKLVLNRSAEDGRMGDLVFLIGPNNSGKSNVIDALESIRKGTSEGDIPERGAKGKDPIVFMKPDTESDASASQSVAKQYEASSLREYISACCNDKYEADAVEEFVLSGDYNFSYELDQRCLYDIVGKSRAESVEILRRRDWKYCDTGSAICRLLVGTENDKLTPAPKKKRNSGPVRVLDIPDYAFEVSKIVEGFKIPYDSFAPYVAFAKMPSEEALQKLDGAFKGSAYRRTSKLSDLYFEEFIGSEYIGGNILTNGFAADELFSNLASILQPRSKQITAVIDRLQELILDPYVNAKEKSLALRILYRYLCDAFDESADSRKSNDIMSMALIFDPFSKISPKWWKPTASTSMATSTNIVRYVPNLNHKDSEMIMEFGKYGSPIMNILTHVGITSEFIDNFLDNIERLGGHPGLFRQMEDEMRDKLKPVNEQFNRLYGCSTDEYTLEPYVINGTIDVRMSKGNVPIRLDNQSTGFKWFFDFFLNVICGNGLSPGDIVLMDEPATNLHVRGQAELREVMKRFAVENQVTFVISTHSPFLISCDYLDEVRIVSRDEKGFVSIENNFQVCTSDDDEDDEGSGKRKDYSADNIENVLNALTVGRHVVKDPRTPTIFVEGITDYNYLTAFARLLGVEGVSFLPIGGVRNKHLGKKLKAIERDPILLVDSDEGGYIAKGKYGGKGASPAEKIQVVTLEDIDPSFVGEYRFSDFNGRPEGLRGFTIEDLFSEEDKERILKDRKESDFSSVFKSYIDVYGEQVSEETKENFRKVLEYFKKEMFLA